MNKELPYWWRVRYLNTSAWSVCSEMWLLTGSVLAIIGSCVSTTAVVQPFRIFSTGSVKIATAEQCKTSSILSGIYQILHCNTCRIWWHHSWTRRARKSHATLSLEPWSKWCIWDLTWKKLHFSRTFRKEESTLNPILVAWLFGVQRKLRNWTLRLRQCVQIQWLMQHLNWRCQVLS